MKLVISPAKTLDFESAPVTQTYSDPSFLENSQLLVDELKELSQADVATLMKLSDKLAALNVARFGSWETPFTPDNAKQAILAFKGDVYTGLDAESFSEEDFSFAQNHLRILSGLYGLLKPLDLIQPYRLEMGTKFTNSRGKNLYEFWDMQLTDALNNEFAEEKEPVLINLASNEYFKAVKTKNLQAEIITPVFKDWKNGQYKMISFYAKKARGLMAAYIIQNQLSDPEQLKNFDTEGYYFNEEQSKGNEWVFLRDHDE
ncbi:peroxide stress protein YaaA [Oceanospirillum sanctuarii]|uniref:peroxide stress protein YaaA n=1 Tax=Oceanospirillum sanctuarii TaxID=1434821 RepID=UPI000A36DCEF|nr:peroxide stress protein YaaA [Oceanospirillum sanctuarii]